MSGKMNWTEMLDVVKDARQTIHYADGLINRVADLLCGRMQSARVPHRNLAELKRELRAYNTKTRKWGAT